MLNWTKLATTTTAISLLTWALVAGCGGDPEGSGGAGATTGAGAGQGTGGGFLATGGSSGTGEFDACASAAIQVDRIPVQMYIMFDKSGSMLEDQKWAGATAALTAFFQDSDSAGLNVALRFFPDDEPVSGCNESACNVQACATPLVDVGELNASPAYADPQQAALVDAVQSRSPAGQTPMYAALAGATSWATAHASENLRTVVVLVTDGEPNGCNEDPNAIAALAGDAHASDEVLTYAIGMAGADIAQLNLVAAAGGTDKAFVVGQGSVHKDLVDALQSIGTAPIGCVMAVPESSTVGEEVDPALVNITFTPGEGETPETIPQVSGMAACDASGGWFYDDPNSPGTIELCPTTCESIQGIPGGQLEIVLGCETVIK